MSNVLRSVVDAHKDFRKEVCILTCGRFPLYLPRIFDTGHNNLQRGTPCIQLHTRFLWWCRIYRREDWIESRDLSKAEVAMNGSLQLLRLQLVHCRTLLQKCTQCTPPPSHTTWRCLSYHSKYSMHSNDRLKIFLPFFYLFSFIYSLLIFKTTFPKANAKNVLKFKQAPLLALNPHLSLCPSPGGRIRLTCHSISSLPWDFLTPTSPIWFLNTKLFIQDHKVISI